jgi:hypothetical protein
MQVDLSTMTANVAQAIVYPSDWAATRRRPRFASASATRSPPT